MAKRIYIIVIYFLFFNNFYINSQLNKNYFLNIGRTDLIEEDYTSAIKRFNVVIGIHSDMFESYFFRGIAKFNLGDFQGALRDFNKTLELNPVFTDAFHYRAITYERLHDYRSALADYDIAVDLRPNSAYIYLNRGIAKLNFNKYEEAVADFNRSISLNTDIPEAYLNRGSAKLYLNDTIGAFKDYDFTIKMNPFYPDAYNRRGRLFLLTKEYTKALSDFNNAVSLDTLNPICFFNRAFAYEALDSLSKTLKDFDKVIELNPDNSLTLYNRALLKWQNGDIDGAILDLDKVIEINPRNVYSYFNRGLINSQKGNIKAAINDYDKAIELYPDFAKAFLNRSELKKRLNDNKGSLLDFRMAENKIKEYKEKSTEELNNFADTSVNYSKMIAFDADFYRGGSVKRIQYSHIDIELLPLYSFVKNNSVAYESFDPKYYNTYAENMNKIKYKNLFFEISNESTVMAADSILDILRQNSLDITYDSEIKNILLFYNGILNQEIQNYNSSITYYEQCIANNPTFLPAYFNLAYTQSKMISFINSIGERSSVIKINNDKSVYNQNTEEVILVDYSDAINTFSQVIKLDSSFSFAYYNRATLKAFMKDYDGAIVDYDKAIASNKYLGEAYFNKGLVLLYLKRNKEACESISIAGEKGVSQSYNVIKRFCKTL